jgi:hypothetical protein
MKYVFSRLHYHVLLKGICYFCIDFDSANITVQSKLHETSLIHFCEQNVATFFERPKLKPVFFERCKSGKNSPWQLSRDRQKNFVDIVGVLCGRLHEEESVLFGVTVGLLVLHRAPVRQVRLVAGKRNHYVRPGKTI